MATWTSSPGLVLVDKPCGWTSRRAGAVVSKQLGIKIGHQAPWIHSQRVCCRCVLGVVHA